MKALTDRQKSILDFIVGEFKRTFIIPTVREIGAEFGIKSTNGVVDHLRALERKGWIIKLDNQKTRCLYFTQKTRKKYELYWRCNQCVK
jgi:repressor LexA